MFNQLPKDDILNHLTREVGISWHFFLEEHVEPAYTFMGDKGSFTCVITKPACEVNYLFLLGKKTKLNLHEIVDEKQI